MLIYNTTYHTSMDDARNIVIWLHEAYIPQVVEEGSLRNPRLVRVLSHKDPNSECFSLQWEVDDSTALHRWYVKQGEKLDGEITRIFKDNVLGFTTLMEVIE